MELRKLVDIARVILSLRRASHARLVFPPSQPGTPSTPVPGLYTLGSWIPCPACGTTVAPGAPPSTAPFRLVRYGVADLSFDYIESISLFFEP